MADQMMDAVERLDNLIDGLQLLYENQVTNTLMGLDPNGIKDMSAVYIRMRRLWDVVEALTKFNSKQYERIEGKLGQFMNDADLGSYTVVGAGRIGISTKLFANIRPEKKKEGYEWLRSSGNAPLITETVNYQSFSAFVRAEIEANRDVPEDLVNTFFKTTVSFTKTK